MASDDKENVDPVQMCERECVNVQGLSDLLTSQILECQTLSAALRKGIVKQKEDLEILTKTHQMLHRTQQDLLGSLIVWLNNSPKSLANSEIVDGTVMSTKLNVHKSTALFCVGMPDLTNTAIRQYAAAIAKLQHLNEDDSENRDAAEGLPEGDETEQLRRPPKSKSQPLAVIKPDPLLRAASAPPNRVTHNMSNLVHSLLSGANWRRAVELVTQLRHIEERKTHDVPVDDVGERGLAERSGLKKVPTSPMLLRQLLQQEKLRRTTLLGRDDYLFMDIIVDDDSVSIRCEIIVPNQEIYESWEQPIQSGNGSSGRATTYDEVVAEIQTAIDWAVERVEKLPSTLHSVENCGWSGDFAEFLIRTGEYPDAQASVRFIPLMTGGHSKDLSKFREMCKESKFYNRDLPSRSNHGMWKAELRQKEKQTRAAFQRTMKQSGSYQKALTETMNWALTKCQQLGIDHIWYKGKQDSCLLNVQGQLSNLTESRKRSRRSGDSATNWDELKKRKQ